MYGQELLMMGRMAARNMYSSNTNKVGIQCSCWFYSQGICYDARSYDRKMHRDVSVIAVFNDWKCHCDAASVSQSVRSDVEPLVGPCYGS